MRQWGISQRVSGIFRNGLTEVGNGSLQIRGRSLVECVPTVRVKVVSFRILRALLCDQLLFRTAHTGAQPRRQVASDLLLQCDHLAAFSAVMLPPQLVVVADVGELRAYLHVISACGHTPTDQRR